MPVNSLLLDVAKFSCTSMLNAPAVAKQAWSTACTCYIQVTCHTALLHLDFVRHAGMVSLDFNFNTGGQM